MAARSPPILKACSADTAPPCSSNVTTARRLIINMWMTSWAVRRAAAEQSATLSALQRGQGKKHPGPENRFGSTAAATEHSVWALALTVEVTAHELQSPFAALSQRPHRLRRLPRRRPAAALDQTPAPNTFSGCCSSEFGAMIGENDEWHINPDPPRLWRVTVESWLRCQGLIAVRQNQKQMCQPLFKNLVSQLNWSHNL